MRSTLILLTVGASLTMVGSVPARASETRVEGVSPSNRGQDARDPTPPGITANRRVIDLNGTWQVAEGAMDAMPKQFEHTVPVPGLIDMAKPAFTGVGKKSSQRQAFWYRRTFVVEGTIPAVALLKIHKARYGTKVWLNGQEVGEHLPCFTPALLDVKPSLKGSAEQNELVVRVGADRESRPTDVPSGWDFEKYLYIPGIYDSVELILTGVPHIVNVQTAPDLVHASVRVRVTLRSSDEIRMFPLDLIVREAVSGREVGREAANPPMGKNEEKTFDETVHLRDCHYWSPEDPFLYELEVNTHSDQSKVRFGMRSFRFDAATGRAILNGRPYFLRGTNVCAYRFFEDAERGDKPWRAEWVRRLHQQFKSMHWDAIRYCIGFPPELWYDIADELGFLIQDEFPIWLGGKAPENPTAEKIIPEYTEWMRERWNHPCVVIWDAQNESYTPETGKALMAVRHLDLSNRPWENGWAEPQTDQDCVESHPYLFSRGSQGKNPFFLREIEKVSGTPHLQKPQQKLRVPIIINEYDWLWLNRDGSCTCLTKKVYESLLGPNSTVEQRRRLHARYVAALTEFWRGHRQAAGVLHFCGLGYSRAADKPVPEGGATCDDFLDLEKLNFEPNFEKYVRDAFSPVGLMLDYWGRDLPAGQEHEFKVVVINDLYENWQGRVRLRLLRNDDAITIRYLPCTVAALGSETLSFRQPVPTEPGDYVVMAELMSGPDASVRSLRDAKIVPAP